MAFSSQFGTYAMESLPVVSGGQGQWVAPPPPVQQPAVQAQYATPSSGGANNQPSSREDILGTLERLGSLRERGFITDEEFNAKKADLLNRL